MDALGVHEAVAQPREPNMSMEVFDELLPWNCKPDSILSDAARSRTG